MAATRAARAKCGNWLRRQCHGFHLRARSQVTNRVGVRQLRKEKARHASPKSHRAQLRPDSAAADVDVGNGTDPQWSCDTRAQPNAEALPHEMKTSLGIQ